MPDRRAEKFCGSSHGSGRRRHLGMHRQSTQLGLVISGIPVALTLIEPTLLMPLILSAGITSIHTQLLELASQMQNRPTLPTMKAMTATRIDPIVIRNGCYRSQKRWLRVLIDIVNSSHLVRCSPCQLDQAHPIRVKTGISSRCDRSYNSRYESGSDTDVD